MPPVAIAAGVVAAAGIGAAIAAKSSGAGKTDYKAQGFTENAGYDKNRYEYGGKPGGAAEDAGRYAGMAAYANSQADQYRNLGMEARGQQSQALGMMMNRAQGRDLISSKIALANRSNLRSQQQAQAAGARGPAALALAQQNAANATAQGEGQINQAEIIGGAQEQTAAEQAAFGAASGMRQGDIGTSQGLDQKGVAYSGLENQVNAQQLQANIAQQQGQLNALTSQQAVNAGVATHNAAASMMPYQMAAGGISGAAQLYAMGSGSKGGGNGNGGDSDPRAKADVYYLDEPPGRQLHVGDDGRGRLVSLAESSAGGEGAASFSRPTPRFSVKQGPLAGGGAPKAKREPRDLNREADELLAYLRAQQEAQMARGPAVRPSLERDGVEPSYTSDPRAKALAFQEGYDHGVKRAAEASRDPKGHGLQIRLAQHGDVVNDLTPDEYVEARTPLRERVDPTNGETIPTLPPRPLPAGAPVVPPPSPERIRNEDRARRASEARKDAGALGGVGALGASGIFSGPGAAVGYPVIGGGIVRKLDANDLENGMEAERSVDLAARIRAATERARGLPPSGQSDPKAKIGVDGTGEAPALRSGSHNNEIAQALDATPAVAYRYKDPQRSEPNAERPGEQQVGFLTTDLKKTPVGATVVETGPDGLEQYNSHRLFGLHHAFIRNVHERLRDIEATIAKSKGGT